MRLARVAHNCAILDADVAELCDGDGRWVTPVTDDAAIGGVLVTADPAGGYAIEVHLVALPVPLHALAVRLQTRIVDAVFELGLLGEVARVHVHVDGLATDPVGDDAA
ncbi:hypothetical protein [Paraconexibacter sp. AEG42_29]|uniref:hypothetical protein n=1 Tax=Paraconexibacter sp. AEG42_29 TaxID=2997339 RepID=UPI00339D3794